MKSWISCTLGLVLLVSQTALSTPASSTQKLKDHEAWTRKMQELYKSFSQILTHTSSESFFSAPENRSLILSEAESFRNLTHKLDAHKMMPSDNDPTLKIVGKLLREQSEIAVSALKQNKPDFARRILRSMPSYCISCHTRNATGPQFSMMQLEPSYTGLSDLELGQFYAASRQFDRALEQFRKVSKSVSSVDKTPWVRETATHQSLLIAVRVKEDPKLSKNIINDVLNSPLASGAFKKDAQAWALSIQEWENEKPTQNESTTALLKKAKVLLEKAKQTQSYPLDRSADILYLRASAILHSVLQRNDLGSNMAEALFLAGHSYEVLRPIGIEDMQTIYYEACIQTAPHSAISKKCFKSYKDSIVFGFSGSSGVHLPESVKQKLIRLELLSESKKT